MQPIGFLYLYPPNNYGIGAKNQTKNPKSHLRLLDYPIGREIHCLPAYRIGSHIYRCHGKYRQRRAGGISLYCIRLASRPRDDSHPFGHGKIEMISASMEGILIIMAGAIIIYHGFERLFTPSPLSHLDIGIYITAAAGIANYFLGMLSIKTGRKHRSEALVAGGKHLQSDTYSTIGLVAGLILVKITGITLIDSLMALIFGGLIIFTGISILRKTIATLTDKADPENL